MRFSTHMVLTALLCLQFNNCAYAVGNLQTDLATPLEMKSEKRKAKAITQHFGIKATTQVAIVDGELTERLWSKANKLTDFHQIAPNEFTKPAEKTEVYVTYNKDYLYIGAKLYDSEMNGLLHKVIAPGQNIFSDDYFALVLDTFNDGTNGYFFATNANSYKEDALTLNNNKRISDWKGVWIVESKIKEDHWTVEIAIPFKSVNFDPSLNDWGINFIRELKDPQQTIVWSSHGNTLYPWASEYAGKATGLITTGDNAITQGVGLDVKLSVTANQQRDHVYGNNTNDSTPSVDIFYKPTPKITTALTLNTDFSATEVDEQQVNLSRFSLYTPEKRDFFLQDAGIFEFGKLSQNGKAFFSRQIGLDPNGTPLNINAGVKVAGQQGAISFGLLGINQQQLNGQEQNLLVSRVKYDINKDVTAGAILTKGSPVEGEDNQLIGSDFLFRNKTWLKGDIVEVSGWLQSSHTSYNHAGLSINKSASKDNNQLNTNNNAYGFTVSAPNDDLFSEFTFTEIQSNFNPALGFVNRAGIRQYDLSLSVKNNHKLGWMNWLYHSLFATKVTNMDNQTQSQSAALILFETIDKKENYFECQFIYKYERVEQDFEVLPNLIVSAGDHSFNSGSCGVSTGEAYPISAYLVINKGGFYQGTTDAIDMGVWSNINQFLRLEFNYGLNTITLDDNQFDLELFSAKVDIAFSSKLFWNNWFQYNNVDETLGVFSRLRWEYSPVSQMDFVLNQGYLQTDKIGTEQASNWQTQQQDIAIKLSYTYRF